MRRLSAPWAAVIVAITTMAIAGVVWAVRLEGRHAANERELAALRVQYTDTIQHIRHELAYVRMRLDQVLDRGVR